MNSSNDRIPHPSENTPDRSAPVYDSAANTTAAEGPETASSENGGDAAAGGTFRDTARDGLVCPNCGGALIGRKCKLFCQTPGCGYLVTCSEW